MNEKSSQTSIEVLLSPTQEPDKDLNHLARSVIGAGIEVHRHLGPVLPSHSTRLLSSLN